MKRLWREPTPEETANATGVTCVDGPLAGRVTMVPWLNRYRPGEIITIEFQTSSRFEATAHHYRIVEGPVLRWAETADQKPHTDFGICAGRLT